MNANHAHSDLAIIALHFPTAYSRDPVGALAFLQLLLLDESLIDARALCLKSLAGTDWQSPSNEHRFDNECELICEIGLIDHFRAGEFTADLVQGLHKLSCDPAAMRFVHRRLMAALKEIEDEPTVEGVTPAN